VADITDFKNIVEAVVASFDVDMLKYTWLKLEYHLGILCVTSAAHVECTE
jgi:hypothetical protein